MTRRRSLLRGFVAAPTAKRGLLVSLVVAVLAIGASTALGSHSAAATKCGGKMAILVWPHGHQVIQSVNFPAIVNPHVEVYVGWNPKYPEGQYGGYVVGGKPKASIPVGDVNLHLDCVDYGTAAKATAVIPGGVKVSTQTALRCTLRGSGVFDLVERGGGSRVLILHNGPKVLLRADASQTTASVTVPKGACTRNAVPH